MVVAAVLQQHGRREMFLLLKELMCDSLSVSFACQHLVICEHAALTPDSY